MNFSTNRKYITTKDHFKTGESFDLFLDSKRELLITCPQPSIENLERYYDSEEYISHNDEAKGLMAFLYKAVKKYSLSNKVKLVNSLSADKSTLLDIGAGTGEFCKSIFENGWNVQGVEPSTKARELAKTKGLDLKESIDDYTGNKFTVITLWHVLEHLPDLQKTLLKIEALLEKDGVLIIAVPNYKSYDAHYYKEFWAAFDVPRHLWHFSRESMNVIFSNDLRLTKTKPLLFDSFYVSLLSEKYKSNASFSLKALLVGLWSNLKALRTKEHSSLIYCYRKF
ncbi:MAG: 2-polyprenyl-3-methyl-5-hydroxy-6-metoxy-1,4-benzoquinol methylase [Patiriisocius sp.]